MYKVFCVTKYLVIIAIIAIILLLLFLILILYFKDGSLLKLLTDVWYCSSMILLIFLYVYSVKFLAISLA